MELLKLFFLSMMASFCFGRLFKVPLHACAPTAVIGGVGYVVYSVVQPYGEVAASCAGAVFVAICCEVTARVIKVPVVVVLLAGIIPLVPGAWLYRTIVFLMENQYGQALSAGILTIAIAGGMSLAVGLVSYSAMLIEKKPR